MFSGVLVVSTAILNHLLPKQLSVPKTLRFENAEIRCDFYLAAQKKFASDFASDFLAIFLR